MNNFNLNVIDTLDFNNFISGENDAFINGKTDLNYINKLHKSSIVKQEIHPEKGSGNINEIQSALNLSLPQDQMLNIINPPIDYNSLFIVGECWKPITEASVSNITEGMYYVSNFGRVISDARCRHGIRLLFPVEEESGYLRVGIREKDNRFRYHTIHRIVKIEFDPIPNYNNYQVNHFDGNKHNNCLSNLQWCTCSDNIKHSYKLGLSKANKDHSTNVFIDECKADQIGQLLASQQYTHKQIAEIVNCNVNIVQSISARVNWKWVYDKYDLGKTKNERGFYTTK